MNYSGVLETIRNVAKQIKNQSMDTKREETYSPTKTLKAS